MNWSDTLHERAVIADLESSYYDTQDEDYEDDYEEEKEEEDDNH